jgi:hypothetical protein
VDGVDRTSDALLTPLAAGGQSLRFGREQAEFFRGRIDEIRIAPLARSAAWMAAQHLSMSDAFVRFGAPEDRSALSATASVLLDPATVTLQLRSYPAGLELGVGASLAAAPFSTTVIEGSTQSLAAPSPQGLGGTSYAFQLWSDGGAQNHNTVVTAADPTRTAYFLLPECADGLDNDGDGDVDHPEDPGCVPLGLAEGTACDDDLDNDADGKLDWDGAGVGAADPACQGDPRRRREGPACGLGFELALVLPLLRALRRRAARGARA